MSKDQPLKQHESAGAAGDSSIVDTTLYESVGIKGMKTMTSGGVKQQIAEGPIKALDIPTGWNRTTEFTDPVGSVIKFSPGLGKSSLNSLEHQQPISQKAQEAFSKLLEDNANLAKPKMLTPDQIRSISEVLGDRHMGDNQYTNKAPYPSPNSPLFKLTNAQLKSVNGHTVLEVEGSFMDQNGKPTEFYQGILSPSKNSGKINEFFLAAPDRDELIQHDHAYRKAVRSIEWR